MGRNISSILKYVSFSNHLSSFCWLFLWYESKIIFCVCLRFLIYAKDVLVFSRFFYQPVNKPLASTFIFHLLFSSLLLISVSVECPCVKKWDVFPQATGAYLFGYNIKPTKQLTYLSAIVWEAETFLPFSEYFTFFLREAAAATPELLYGEVTVPYYVFPLPTQEMYLFFTSCAHTSFHEIFLCSESCVLSFSIHVCSQRGFLNFLL